jgi:hypothetical protein
MVFRPLRSKRSASAFRHRRMARRERFARSSDGFGDRGFALSYRRVKIGAIAGSRTRIVCLASRKSAIDLRPQTPKRTDTFRLTLAAGFSLAVLQVLQETCVLKIKNPTLFIE